MLRITSRKSGRRSFLQQASRRLCSRRYRPLVEALEGRHLLATITVTGTGDTIAVDALATLREDHRDALRLRVIEQRSYPEVARALSCTEENARQRVSRGLRRLALVLQEKGLQPATEATTEMET